MFLTVKKSSMTKQGPQCGLHKVWDSARNVLIGVTDMLMQMDHWELIKDCKTVSHLFFTRVFSELPWRVAAGAPGRSWKDSYGPGFDVSLLPCFIAQVWATEPARIQDTATQERE